MRKFDLLKGKTAFNRDRAVYYMRSEANKPADFYILVQRGA